MVAPQEKYGISTVYRNASETIARSSNAVSKVAQAAQYAGDNLVISSKIAVLESYKETLETFGIDTSTLTPAEVKKQAEELLAF